VIALEAEGDAAGHDVGAVAKATAMPQRPKIRTLAGRLRPNRVMLNLAVSNLVRTDHPAAIGRAEKRPMRIFPRCVAREISEARRTKTQRPAKTRSAPRAGRDGVDNAR